MENTAPSPPPGEEISADVLGGKNIKSGREKAGKIKENEERGKKKRKGEVKG